MIGKILIAALAVATLFIATGHAAIVSDGRNPSATLAAGAVLPEGIRYDGVRAPGSTARLAQAAPVVRLRF